MQSKPRLKAKLSLGFWIRSAILTTLKMRQERSKFRAFLYYKMSPRWGLETWRPYLKIKTEREGYECSRMVESLPRVGKAKVL